MYYDLYTKVITILTLATRNDIDPAWTAHGTKQQKKTSRFVSKEIAVSP